MATITIKPGGPHGGFPSSAPLILLHQLPKMSLGASGPQSQCLTGGASFLWCLLPAECEALGCSQVPWASETTFWGGTWVRKMGISSLLGNWVIIEKAGDSGRQEEDGGGVWP